jgi:hypothetical protein
MTDFNKLTRGDERERMTKAIEKCARAMLKRRGLREENWLDQPTQNTLAADIRCSRSARTMEGSASKIGRAMSQLILKRASASRPGGEWDDDDYDVVTDGVTVGRIMKAAAAPVGTPWLWTLGYGHHEDRSPTHGYEPTREAAMAAFAKSWRRQ